ncbi:TIGR03089 family protein [Arthrobacter parietis]|uniref:TIGR03089 family protein n=1 Tax=Arthrobacter parietis TaxID=271434 RepID=A0ABN3AYQ1_9MICC
MAPLKSVAELCESLRSASGAPRLIWYGPGSERVELSGRVLENWVAKTSNMLVEELDAVAGTVVAVGMPPHWKSLVWALASWRVGAVTVLRDETVRNDGTAPGDRTAPDDGAPVDVRLTMDAAPGAPRVGREGDREDELLVLVAPGALDMRWPGTLPSGAVDYAATVRAFGDVYLEDPADSGAELIRAGGKSFTFSDLLDGADQPAEGIWLVPASLPLLTVLPAAVRIWAAGGTVVLVHPEVEATDRLMEGERVTARLAV